MGFKKLIQRTENCESFPLYTVAISAVSVVIYNVLTRLLRSADDVIIDHNQILEEAVAEGSHL